MMRWKSRSGSSQHGLSLVLLDGRYQITFQHTQCDPSPRTLAVLETGLGILIQEFHRPGKFELGQHLTTPGADLAIRAARQEPPE